jgi:virginiamycin A acetyltransferase
MSYRPYFGIMTTPQNIPDPMAVHPIAGYDKEIYVKPTLKNPNIVVGDFTYIADSEFESHVTHLYPWNNDKLVIGKFCQIAAGVEFVMNGANHQMNAVSTFPFYTLAGWDMKAPAPADMPLKGDTIIGNDVWIGQNVTILPGVHIGDGAIIGASSVVGSNVEPYTIVAGNPVQFIRKRFDEELTNLMLEWRWWDKPIEEINSLIPVLTSSDLTEVKKKIKGLLNTAFSDIERNTPKEE